jgi:hypothetical protein
VTRPLGDAVITSRLLILQSKRLLLSSIERRLRIASVESLRQHLELLVAECESAWTAYRASILRWGSPQNQEYWLVAYSGLIDRGNTLSDRLANASADMSPADRYRLAVEVEKLDDMVEHWTVSMRATMTSSAS